MRNFIQPSDPNEKLAHVINTITKVTRSTFEFRKLTRKESKSDKKPWMTPALIKSCRKRKKLYHKKQRKNDPVVDEEYRISKIN